MAAEHQRWSGRPVQAAVLRSLVYLVPLGGSVVFVHFASQVVPAPAGSLWLFLSWWLGLSMLATVVLVSLDRVTRRALPLAALLKLSLVFPDQAPSRFKVALRSGSVEHLQETIGAASSAGTPSDAAARLLQLVAALNIHDRLTRGHCERVRAYAVLIGEELGLSKHDLDMLNWAALLHDVGKLRVPTEILTNEGRPSAREWTVLRQHPRFGEELVEPIRSWLGTWTEAVGFHHERWDGGGYPHGLAGEAIPLAGRIVAVADVFDVMTSARSYKRAGAALTAREELAHCAGTQFDPHVVRAFLNVGLGRMRLVMGPLSWLAHAPLLARLPLTPAMGTLAGAFTVAAGSTAGGLVAPPAAPAAAPVAPPARVQPARPVTPALARPALEHVRLVPSVSRHRAAAPPPVVQAPQPSAAQPVPTAPSAPAAAPVPVDDHATVGEGQSVTVDVLANDGGGPLQLASVGTPAHGSAAALGASVVYAAPAFFAGTDTFSYTVAGSAGTTASATVSVDVLPVNHAPTFRPGSDVSVLEDSGAYTGVWAAAIDPGRGDGRQAVRFVVTATRPELFAAGPQIDAGGTLRFTPRADAYGTTGVRVTAVDDGGRSDGGSDRSDPVTFTIDVAPVNDAPSFTPGGDVSVVEGTGAQARQWASGIAPGPANESGQHVSFTATVDNPALFAVGGQPAVDPAGVLLFTPKSLASGTATVTVSATDDGGTANGGHDTTSATFTITVVHVNQAPRFTGAGNQSVAEDSGAHTTQWATSIDAGAPDEGSQTVTFSATNNNPALFSAQPALDGSGRLTYTPAANANGSATVTVTAQDNGGTVGGGHDSTSSSFTITVTPVNDAPSFTGAGSQSVLEDAGAQSVQWATAISPGPANESGQTVAFAVSNDNNGLFSVQPAIGAGGVLSYTPAANANGSATVTVTAQDNGGTVGGGHDSTSSSFTITVTPVNDAPTIAPIANQAISENDVAQTVAVTSLAAGPANESGQTLSITTATDHPEYFDLAGPPSIDSNGTLTYTPALGAFGVATVTVTVQDDGGTAGGGHDTASTTFTITISALPPIAGDDSYTTTLGTPLHVAAPGVLANDADVNSVTLDAVAVTNVATSAGGTVSIQADGTLDYTPPVSVLAFNDTVTYQIIDGNGQTATGTITIAVTLLPASTSTLYLDTSGLSADVWNLVSSPVATQSPVPDLDGDNHPGLTIAGGGDGNETITDPKKQHAWAFETGLLGLSLHGPLIIHLTAATQNFDTGKAVTAYLYVYNCPGGDSSISIASCTKLAENVVLVSDWNTTSGYASHDIGAALDVDLPAGRQLRVRLLLRGPGLWIPLVGPYGSSLDYTG